MIALLLVACGPVTVGEPEPASDESGAIFPRDRLVEVAVTLDPADWAALRAQTRDVWDLFSGDCLAEPFDSPFTWFRGDVAVDGVDVSGVGVRKKGFLGSLSEERPALKLRFDRYRDDGELLDLRALSLNNVQQDPAVVRTCLAYGIFEAAGVPAPRCALAHVAVNGEDLGAYALVETGGAEMLDRRVPGHGAMWEGTVSDFRDGWLDTFELETEAGDGARLAALADALDAGDDALLDELGAVLDVEAFLDFWAAEVLTGHWDGYTGNTNNFFVYEAEDGRLRFLPWGADAALSSRDVFGEGRPRWVVATSRLAWRLARNEDAQALYREHLAGALARAWDEDALLAEVDRMAGLVAPVAGDGFDDAVDDLRAVVRRHGDDVADGLDGAWPDVADALRGTPCFVERGTVEATFATTWGSYGTEDAWTYGDASLALTWDGNGVPLASTAVVAGETEAGKAAVVVVARIDDATAVAPYVAFDADAVGPGSMAIDFDEASGALLYMDATTGGEFVQAAYIAGGEVALDEASARAGASVRGTFHGTLVTFGW